MPAQALHPLTRGNAEHQHDAARTAWGKRKRSGDVCTPPPSRQSHITYPVIFGGLLFWYSTSSTVQTAPFTFSTRTKHLCRLRLWRTAFCGSQTEMPSYYSQSFNLPAALRSDDEPGRSVIPMRGPDGPVGGSSGSQTELSPKAREQEVSGCKPITSRLRAPRPVSTPRHVTASWRLKTICQNLSPKGQYSNLTQEKREPFPSPTPADDAGLHPLNFY